MLEIKRIRENVPMIKQALLNRNCKVDIDEVLTLSEQYREELAKCEQKKAKQNILSKQIPQYKKEGKDTASLMEELKTLSVEIKEFDEKQKQLSAKLDEILLNIPNIPNSDVPVGKDEKDNLEIRKVLDVKKFNFTPLAHWEIGENLGILDPATAAKVTGARFHFYKGAGARLERAVINFFLDYHTKNGYTEILPPFIANEASMMGTGQLPKFSEDMFKLENLPYYLIPTAEVPVTNMYRGDILEEQMLPLKFAAYSACFRAEAGSAGRDTRGLIRQHQFNKVELVKFVKPEESYSELEKLTSDASGVLTALGLPHRVVLLCTGDMGFGSAKTYDIEAFMPSYDRYVEISSCTNFEDFQARRAQIRYKGDVRDKAKYVHTLNGSGVAVGRTVACILETYQNEDGSVSVPKVLQPYMGMEVIRGI